MKKIFYILSAAVLMATACTREIFPEQSVLKTTAVAPEDGDMAVVRFNITVPETSLFATQTRAQHPIGDQPSIENGDLYVAVFGNGDGTKPGIGGNLQHFLKATLQETIEHDVDMTTTTTTDDETGESTTTITRAYTYVYEVLMPLSNDPLVLDFMVGACDSEGHLYTLDNPLPVAYEDEVMPRLFSINDNAAYWQRIVIDGVYPKKVTVNGKEEYVMTQYIEGYDAYDNPIYTSDQDYVADDIPQLDNVQLIRNFAKITFTAGADAPFTLDGFYLVDTPISGTLAPYTAANGYNTAYTSAIDAATIIGSYTGYVGSYLLNSGIEGKEFLTPGTVYDYMYERTIPSNSDPVFNETGAILKVTWNANSEVGATLGSNLTRYYKVSLFGKIDDKEGYLPILRNIQYNFEIENITAQQHPTTPQAAYDGGFLGDVSANVATAMLDEIGNGKSRIHVSTMDKAFVGEDNTQNVDFWFYPVDGNAEVVVTDGKTSTAAGAVVTITTSIETVSGFEQAITSISNVVVNRTGTADNYGTVTVNLKDSDEGSEEQEGKIYKGKLKILGQVAGRRALYREVVFTVMPRQNFTKSVTTTDDDGEQTTVKTPSSVTPLTTDAMDQEVTVTIQLPDALPRDIFPLQIKIEAQNNCLYSIPDNSVSPAVSALPVKYGTSAFGTNKNNYYFVKTITYDDYATLSGVTYTYTNAFPCKFKTRLGNGQNATTISIKDINDEYFNETTLTLSVQ